MKAKIRYEPDYRGWRLTIAGAEELHTGLYEDWDSALRGGLAYLRYFHEEQTLEVGSGA